MSYSAIVHQVTLIQIPLFNSPRELRHAMHSSGPLAQVTIQKMFSSLTKMRPGPCLL